jgi:hypothetical protein
MSIHKYALLTDIGNDKHEIFHIVRFTDDDEIGLDRLTRYENALDAEDTIFGMIATGKENVFLLSTWDGSNLTAPEVGVPYMEYPGLPEDTSEYALLSDNKIFYMTAIKQGTHSDLKFDAAFSNKVSFKRITDVENVALGYIWDGSQFSIQTNV